MECEKCLHIVQNLLTKCEHQIIENVIREWKSNDKSDTCSNDNDGICMLPCRRPLFFFFFFFFFIEVKKYVLKIILYNKKIHTIIMLLNLHSMYKILYNYHYIIRLLLLYHFSNLYLHLNIFFYWLSK